MSEEFSGVSGSGGIHNFRVRGANRYRKSVVAFDPKLPALDHVQQRNLTLGLPFGTRS